MLLSNIQDNIVKAPMVSAAQTAAQKSAEVSEHLRAGETLDQARQAEEQVRQTHETEQEGIRNQEERDHAIHPDGRRRRKSDAENSEEEPDEPAGEASPPSAASGPSASGLHMIDITI
jgi:hypothetical protein